MTTLPKVMDNRAGSSPDYTVRRGEISAYGRAVASSKRLRWLILLVGGTAIATLFFMLALSHPIPQSPFLISILLLFLVVVLGLWFIYQFTNRHFIKPGLAFRIWLQQVCDGELDARINLDKHYRHYKEINFHTSNLASSLRLLTDDMDSLVESQTQKLNDQKQVLELLFKLTADVSNEAEEEAAYVTVCHYLAEWFGAANVSCHRIVDDERVLRCVTSRISDKNGNVGSSAEDFSDRGIGSVTLDRIPKTVSTVRSTTDSSANMIWVPFFAGSQTAGVVIIKMEEPQRLERNDTKQVLTTVSEQLSFLCGKQLVQEQVLKSRLSRDRNELAAEIHDSLAQTLLAVRYQTTLLSEKLASHTGDGAYQDALKINRSIEEANQEVRGLIRENRNPLAEHRYADSLQEVIDQFSHTSGITVFFQSEDSQIRFTPREESVLHRIIGEALNNARKYADANMIRVYLKRESSGVRRILVEDDGIGFQPSMVFDPSQTEPTDSAEHIGLTIMKERALTIAAKLTIDSEPGEGTRISITMPPLIESRSKSA
ncbi:MAG: sensor histidine kinase [Granulosicoccaceae bacterium]